MGLLNIMIAFALITSSPKDREENDLLNSSSMKTEERWRIVNDGVMGGLSSSQAYVNANNKIVFSGKISLENNGGFASLRSPIKDYNFESFTGIELKIKGDGKVYSISIKETSYFTGSFFTANILTERDKWFTVKIPFGDFALHYFGRMVKSISKIPLEKIKEISLLIGDKQEGLFEAEIEFIRVY
jgi:NADH dehydrogenase [ubiquinone] 1 alpha subcomplex assembly factor 1